MHDFLKREHVPHPPEISDWRALLRWLICVMNDDDPSLQFISGVLASCINHGGLTEGQDDAANRVLERIIIKYAAGELDCQCDPSNDGRHGGKPKRSPERMH